MLGGDGSQPAYAAERALSRLEADVAGVFFAAIARSLAAIFAPVTPTPISLDAVGDEVDLESVDLETAAVIARYRLDTLGRGGEVLVAIPQAALEALRKPLSQAAVKAAPPPDPGWAQHIRNEVTRTNVKLTAVLEERAGLLSEVSSLAVGQIVELNATPQTRVRVECNGEALMWCDLGKSNGVYTLRVDSFVDRQREFMDDILAA
jgi:flagellar motor switch protein FliM